MGSKMHAEKKDGAGKTILNIKNNYKGNVHMKKTRKVVGHFKHSGKAMQKLFQIQKDIMSKVDFVKEKLTFPFDRPAKSLRMPKKMIAQKRAAAAAQINAAAAEPAAQRQR